MQKENKTLDWESKPLNVTEFMGHWTEQMAFPLLTVERKSNSKNISLRQSRFKLYENIPDNTRFAKLDHVYSWNVPVWYQLGSNRPTELIWLKASDADVETNLSINTAERDTPWILINPKVSGYYRVNYDIANWLKLISQLNTNHTVSAVFFCSCLCLLDGFEHKKSLTSFMQQK